MSKGRDHGIGSRAGIVSVVVLAIPAILALLFLLSARSMAQEQESTPAEKRRAKKLEKREDALQKLPRQTRRPPTLDELSMVADYEELRPGKGESLYVLSGSVTIDGKEFRITAERIVLWIDREKLDDARKGLDSEVPPGGDATSDVPAGARASGASPILELVTRLYAEEGVEYRSGSEILRAEKLFLDLRKSQGILTEGYLNTYTDTHEKRLSLVLRAEEILQIAENRWRAEDPQFTTCTFEVPHWCAEASTVEIDREADGDVRFTASNVVVRTNRFPVFWLPKVSGGPGGSTFYFKSARAGKTSRFGLFLLTEWGDDIRLSDGSKFGEWTLNLDLLEKRGFGQGLDVEYDRPGYFGDLLTYRIHDEGDEDTGGQPITNRERSRVHYRHRHFLPERFQFDAEVNWLSDRNFLREYYEKEFKEEKPPETVAYLKKAGDHHQLTLTGKWRLNDFQTQTEYLPRAAYDVVFEPLLEEPFLDTNVYYSQRTEVANVRLAVDEDQKRTRFLQGFDDDALADIDPDRIVRTSTFHRVEMPIPLGPAKLSPFHEVGFATFEETLADHDGDERFTAGAGVALTTKLSRTFDVNIPRLKIRGIRHVITPRITYSNTYANTVDPDELIQFDRVDEVDELEVVRLELRNRFQTRGPSGPVNLLDLDAKIDYFPDHQDDNARSFARKKAARPGTFFDPLPDKEESQPWGNLDLELIARVSQRASLQGDLEYDFFESSVVVGNARVVTQLSPTLRTSVGYRGVKGRKSLIIFGVEAGITEKWSALYDERYDFRTNESENRQLVFRRTGHDWIIELGVSRDEGEGDTRYFVSVQPLELFKPRGDRRIGQQPGDDLYSIN